MDFADADPGLRVAAFAGIALASLWLAGWANLGGVAGAARRWVAIAGALAAIPAAVAASVEDGPLFTALAALALAGFVASAAVAAWELAAVGRSPRTPHVLATAPVDRRPAAETRVASFASLTVAAASPPLAQTEVIAGAMPRALGFLVEYTAGGRATRLGAVTTIGRDPQSSIVADSPEVSREHAVIKAEDGRFVLYDLGGRNGTALRRGGRRRPVSAPAPLTDLDVIEAGPARLVFLEAERKDG